MGLFKHCCSSHHPSSASKCSRITRFAAHALLGIAAVTVVAAAFGWVTMSAWNYVIPELFNLPHVTFWQAVALVVLARILVGRIGHRSSGGKCCFSRGASTPDSPPTTCA